MRPINQNPSDIGPSSVYFNLLQADGEGNFDRISHGSKDSTVDVLVFQSPSVVAAQALVDDEYNDDWIDLWVGQAYQALSQIRESEKRVVVIESGTNYTDRQLRALSLTAQQFPTGVISDGLKFEPIVEIVASLTARQERRISIILEELWARCPAGTAGIERHSRQRSARILADQINRQRETLRLALMVEEEAAVNDKLSDELLKTRRTIEENETLEFANINLRTEIESIYASTSWRFSAPIRALRRLLTFGR